MEPIVFILLGFAVMVLSTVNVLVQTTKRTINKWAKEIVERGMIQTAAASELGTIYSNPFNDWFLEVDRDYRFLILRNHKMREKIREYKRLRRLQNILLSSFFVCAVMLVIFSIIYDSM